jgi:DNA-binding PucR family transcriptional regulator
MGVRTKTADALYLHRNTLLHRIQKIEQLTGRDLSRSKELTDLALALRMRPFIMHQSGAGTAPKTN